MLEDASNTFILELRAHDPLRVGPRSWQVFMRFLGLWAPSMRFFNRYSLFFRMSYAIDALNQHYKINAARPPEVNMLHGSMVSIEQAINIYHLLRHVLALDVPGDVVELGCYEGITAVLLRKTLDHAGSDKALHVYDSFEGLPETVPEDGGTRFRKGMFKLPRDRVLDTFRRLHAAPPEIHAGWFKDTLPGELPDKICFAHLDGDLYSSVKESLEFVYPRLSRGAIVVIDDYCDPERLDVHNVLPGVKRACDEFLRDKEEAVQVLIGGHEAHGYFTKR